ncbi:MAG TPA: hypothetical protein VHV78_07570, partial [Gemmatimonadaceae bacterium]|nr:hypothetical protein [Gemmatimonadaceae bacterium]
MTVRSPHRYVARGRLLWTAGVVVAMPLAGIGAQGVVQQGWNPKAVLAQETYAKPPAVVERIVAAPRNNVSFTNPSPDHKYFLKTESEGLPTIEAFGKPHYRLSTGFEVDFKANRARALTTRGSIGLTLIDPLSGAMRTIETPKGAIVNDPVWSPDSRSIAYIASFDASTQIFIADVASGKSVQITTKPLLATRVTTLQWTANGKAISTVLIPDNRGPEPGVTVATGPLIRESDPDKPKVNRNYQSLLEDQHDFDLVDYYTTGQVAVIDAKTKAIKKIGSPALITAVDASPDGQYFRITLQSKPYSHLVPVSNFGTVEQLWDGTGKEITQLAKRNLNDGERN